MKPKLHSDSNSDDSTHEVDEELRGAAESFAESRVNIGMSVMSQLPGDEEEEGVITNSASNLPVSKVKAGM